MSEEVDLLREMRDLLLVIAEPALAKRDERLRSVLKESVKGKVSAKAVLLMDGSRTQKQISQESGINEGNLSRLVKALRANGLLAAQDQKPKLALSVPPTFFEQLEK